VEPLLTVGDVAPILGVSRRTVYELAESRDPTLRIPAVRIGGRLRFALDDIRAYVEAR